MCIWVFSLIICVAIDVGELHYDMLNCLCLLCNCKFRSITLVITGNPIHGGCIAVVQIMVIEHAASLDLLQFLPVAASYHSNMHNAHLCDQAV